ncbi:hypothetical protein [Serratia ureilytica]|uniref:Uncharacterized protein n=1 Tax=Serratia ureilytica TaxID=300181 RepID=A0A9X9BZV6_9GAMM|nr:hypothetical protein [Serratia ureilytica]TXE26905.1 hypothetical protein FOT63_18385 [Serratia ureilytica]
MDANPTWLRVRAALSDGCRFFVVCPAHTLVCSLRPLTLDGLTGVPISHQQRGQNMSHRSIDDFIAENKDKLNEFFSMAIESRPKHSLENRLIAVEVMVCAIAASLDGDSRGNFLKIMNSFSETQSMRKPTNKAVADLSVLSAKFKSYGDSIYYDE